MKILEDKSGMTAYEAAVYDIRDPLVPVRGHGLIQLTSLLHSKVNNTCLISLLLTDQSTPALLPCFLLISQHLPYFLASY